MLHGYYYQYDYGLAEHFGVCSSEMYQGPEGPSWFHLCPSYISVGVMDEATSLQDCSHVFWFFQCYTHKCPRDKASTCLTQSHIAQVHGGIVHGYDFVSLPACMPLYIPALLGENGLSSGISVIIDSCLSSACITVSGWTVTVTEVAMRLSFATLTGTLWELSAAL